MNLNTPTTLRELVVRKTFETGNVIVQRDGALYANGALLMSDEAAAALRAGRHLVAEVRARETKKRFVMTSAAAVFGVVMMILFVRLHGYFSWAMAILETMVIVGTVVTWRQMRVARVELDRLGGKALLPKAKIVP